jgi:hypothetical protein
VNDNNKELKRISNLLNGSVEEFTKACEEIVKVVQHLKIPTYELASKLKLPNWGRNQVDGGGWYIDRCIEVGTGALKPELLFYRCYGHNKLRKFSRADQERLYNTTVKLAVFEEGEWVVVDAYIQNLTKYEANQVFDGVYIRDVSEQIEYHEQKDRKKMAKAKSFSYTVLAGGRLVINQGSRNRTYTIAELEKLLAAAKKGI